MKRFVFILLMVVALTSATITCSSAAETLPEIEITWLSVLGRPGRYLRDEHALVLYEADGPGTGTVKTLNLDSGDVSVGGMADWHAYVPIPFEYGQIGMVENSDGSPMGLCVDKKDDRFRFGFVDINGELVIPCEYDWINPSDYADSFAVDRHGKWGVVDTNNQLIVPFEWDYARGFFEGRAAVSRADELGDAKWGYIDYSGNVVIPLEYDSVGDFREGLAAVARTDEYGHKKWGYIDLTGKVAVPLEYDECSNFHEGLATVGRESAFGNILWGCIDSSGYMVLPVEYELDSISDSCEVGCQAGLIAAGKNGKYGCFNRSGDMVISLEYDDMEYLGDGMYMVKRGASYGIFESPYWPTSNSDEAQIRSTNFPLDTAITALVVGVGGVGLFAIFFLKRHKQTDD